MIVISDLVCPDCGYQYETPEEATNCNCNEGE